MHALKLPDPNGRRRIAILLAFLDDATRRILYACWAWRESAVAFEIGIRHILAAHGRIGRLLRQRLAVHQHPDPPHPRFAQSDPLPFPRS